MTFINRNDRQHPLKRGNAWRKIPSTQCFINCLSNNNWYARWVVDIGLTVGRFVFSQVISWHKYSSFVVISFVGNNLRIYLFIYFRWLILLGGTSIIISGASIIIVILIYFNYYYYCSAHCCSLNCGHIYFPSITATNFIISRLHCYCSLYENFNLRYDLH